MRPPGCILKSLTGVRVSTSLRDCYFNGIHPSALNGTFSADRLPGEIIKKNSREKTAGAETQVENFQITPFFFL